MMLRQPMTANSKLTPARPELMRSEVRYVGITVGSVGIRINGDRIKAIKRLEPPQQSKIIHKGCWEFWLQQEVCQIVRRTQQTSLCSSTESQEFRWTRQRSFEDLKVAISTAPMLCFPEAHDPHNSYQVTIDASKDGLAAALTQLIYGHGSTVG